MKNHWLIIGLLSVTLTVRSAVALRCYKCDSNQNINCATLANMATLTNEDCLNENDSCHSIIGKDGNTIRGCTAEVSSDIPESQYNRACNTGDLCNGAVYPADRLQCHTCQGENCVALQTGTPTVCPNFVENDQCYLVVDHRTSARRGCMSSMTADENAFCEANQLPVNRCITCQSEGCNSMAGTTTTNLRCVVCDSVSTSFCSLDQMPLNPNRNRLCQVALLGHQPSCYTSSQNGIVNRGCTAEQIPEQITACESGAADCNFCSTSNTCNTEPVEGDFCYICDSQQDTNCLTQVTSTMFRMCAGTEGVTGCYRRESGQYVTRGCASELTGAVLNECQDGALCKICQGFGCNRKAEFQSCLVCDSANDLNCLHLTDTGRIAKRICDEYMDTCRTWIPSATLSTARGCFLETPEVTLCIAANRCNECEPNNCNGDMFPANRPRCHQCSGEQCTDVSDASPSLLPCRRFNATAECFSVLQESEVHRGCTFDEITDTDFCRADPLRCVICGTSGCNTDPTSKPASISCQECGPSSICGWSQAHQTPTECVAPIPLGSRETCFTQIQNDVASRGCSNSAIDASCRSNPVSCTQCDASNCNQQNAFVQYCIKCRSSVSGQQSCADTAVGFAPEECFQPFQRFEERGCYTRNDGGVVVRGCITDLQGDDQEQCRDDNYEACQFCIDNGCNILQAPDGAASMKLSVFLLLASVMTIYWIK